MTLFKTIALLFISLHSYAAYQPITTVEVSGTAKVEIVSGSVTVNTTGLATSANQVSQTSVLQSLDSSLAALNSKTPSMGQALAASSTPVVLTAIQLADLKNTSSTITSAPGLATSAKQDTGNTYLQSIDSYVSSALDANLSTRASEATVSGMTPYLSRTADATEGTWNESITHTSQLTSANGYLSVIQSKLTAGPATSFPKAEDNPAASEDVGVPAMAIRSASPSNTSTANNEYEMLQMNNGRLYVDAIISNSVGIASGSVSILNSIGIASGSVTANAGTGTFTTSGTVQLTAGSATIGSIANTAFSVTGAVALASETTKVIGTVNQGGSPWGVSATLGTSLPAGSNLIGAVSATLGSALPTGSNTIGSIANTSFTATQSTATSLKTQAENYQGGSAVAVGNPLWVQVSNTTAVSMTGIPVFALASETTKVIGTVNQGTSPWITSGTQQLTAGSATIGSINNITGTISTHGVTQSGTWNAPSGTTTVSGTAQLTAGTAAIGSITNTQFGATQVGTWLSPSGTTTTSGTTQLTAGSATIGAISNTGFNATVLNSLGIASGTITSITNSVTVSGTQQLTAGTATIGSINNITGTISTHGVTQSGQWLAPSGTTTVSGTAQLTAGTAAIGSITNTSFGATQVGTWNAPSGTTTTSGTVQLTAGSATIGAISNTGFNATVLNSLGIASGTITSITNTVATSGTSLIVPSNAIGDSLLNSDTANVPKVSVKASAGRLYLACFFNGKASTQYMQIFDSASQPATNTAVTIPPLVLASGQTGCFDYNPYGKYMSSGIYAANSTSATAYVNGTSDTIISVQYK